MPPVMKFGHSIGAHQPDESLVRIALPKSFHGIDRVSRAFLPFEVAHADPRALRNRLCRGEAVLERGHVLGVRLERVARRHQPPDLVEAERVHRGQADAPVAAVRRVERAAEEADPSHRRSASMREEPRIMSAKGDWSCRISKRSVTRRQAQWWRTRSSRIRALPTTATPTRRIA